MVLQHEKMKCYRLQYCLWNVAEATKVPNRLPQNKRKEMLLLLRVVTIRVLWAIKETR